MSTALQRLKKRLMKLEIILTIILVSTPIILMVSTQTILPSISAYAYSTSNYIFAFLLSIASSMFIYNGSIFNKSWYNIILGCSLAGVVLTPNIDNPILHPVFAIIFFIGSLVTMNVFATKKQLKYTIIASVIILFGMLGHFLFKWYSLFFAEWIGIVPISLYFYFKSKTT